MAIDVNVYDEVVYITSPTTSVTIQELVDAIRSVEDTEIGMNFDDIITDLQGKVNVGGGYTNPITMELNTNWYIEFWNGVNLGTVAGGNVTEGKDGRPVRAASGSADTILVLGAERGINTGAGLSQENIDDIVDGVWDEQIIDHELVGSIGEWLGMLLRKIRFVASLLG